MPQQPAQKRGHAQQLQATRAQALRQCAPQVPGNEDKAAQGDRSHQVHQAQHHVHKRSTGISNTAANVPGATRKAVQALAELRPSMIMAPGLVLLLSFIGRCPAWCWCCPSCGALIAWYVQRRKGKRYFLGCSWAGSFSRARGLLRGSP